MSIEVTCKGCQKRYRVPERAAGKVLRCKACGASIDIEAVEGDHLEDSGAFSALEPANTPFQAAPYVPSGTRSSGVSSRTIMLIGGAAGGGAALGGVVMVILHVSRSESEAHEDRYCQS